MTHPHHIVLIGFMGSGKTTVGHLVAEKLNWPFVDTDSQIVEEAGLAIPDIFAAEGESGFRERETAVLTRLTTEPPSVISTGGGIITQPRNAPLLKSLGFVVWLSATEADIFSRVSRNRNRPLLLTPDPRQTIHNLLEQRRPLYAAFAHLTIETHGLEPEEIAYGVCESARHYYGAP